MLHGKSKPMVKHFKISGCKFIYYTTLMLNTKLGNIYKELIFLGYFEKKIKLNLTLLKKKRTHFKKCNFCDDAKFELLTNVNESMINTRTFWT